MGYGKTQGQRWWAGEGEGQILPCLPPAWSQPIWVVWCQTEILVQQHEAHNLVSQVGCSSHGRPDDSWDGPLVPAQWLPFSHFSSPPAGPWHTWKDPGRILTSPSLSYISFSGSAPPSTGMKVCLWFGPRVPSDSLSHSHLPSSKTFWVAASP